MGIIIAKLSSMSKVPAVPAVVRIVEALNGLQKTTHQSISELSTNIRELADRVQNAETPDNQDTDVTGISDGDFENMLTAINIIADRITSLEDRCRTDNNKMMQKIGQLTDRLSNQIAEVATQQEEMSDTLQNYTIDERLDMPIGERLDMPELGDSDYEEDNIEDRPIDLKRYPMEKTFHNEFGMIEQNQYNEDGQLHGTCIIRTPPDYVNDRGENETVVIRMDYVNGVLHGQYYEEEGNEKIRTTGGYWNGQATGKWFTDETADDHSNIRTTFYMREGKMNGLYMITAKSIEKVHGQYRDGLKHGEWKIWNPSLKEYDVYNYALGKLNGDCCVGGKKQYYMAGKLIIDYY